MTLAGGAAAAAPARLQRGSDCEGRVQRLSGAPGAAAIVRGTRGLQRFARDVVASSSRSHRRPAVSSPRRRRRVVVSRPSAARVAMFGPCRCVVAVSSPLASPSSFASRRRRLYPHPRPSPPVLVVALSCVRLCPTAILTPRALTTSAGRRSRVILPRLYPHRYPHRNPHRYPRPRPPPHHPSPAPLPETRDGRRLQRL